jgi:uncharacterized membrane protein YdjX (TVP38/TMEM64 family)
MEFDTLREWITLENIMKLIEEYRSFGPIPGIILTMLEAFLPFLPLFLFVMANANAFGLWLGFLFSWLGACAGAMLVFFLVRKYGQKRIFNFLSKHSKVIKLMQWVERHGFGPLFLLLCFPFTPSALVNIVAGLSRISKNQYFLAVLSGKFVMIFTVSFIGHDIRSLVTQPFRTAILGGIIFILWYVGKKIEVKINKGTAKERRKQEG